MEASNNTIILTVYICLAIFFLLSKKISPVSIISAKPIKKDLEMLNTMQVISIFIMMLPMFFMTDLQIALFQIPQETSIWKFIALFIAMLLIFLLPNNHYQTTGSSSTIQFKSKALFYAGARIFYLVIYEWFVHGILLMNLILLTGNIWGVVINVILYMMLHIHKGKKEVLGCIPFGLLLAIFTIWWQSLIPAIILHLELCAKFEWPQLKQNFLTANKTI